MVIDERESRHDYIVDAARQIMTAGRTAPKGKGIDNIEIGRADPKLDSRGSRCTAGISRGDRTEIFPARCRQYRAGRSGNPGRIAHLADGDSIAGIAAMRPVSPKGEMPMLPVH